MARLGGNGAARSVAFAISVVLAGVVASCAPSQPPDAGTITVPAQAGAIAPTSQRGPDASTTPTTPTTPRTPTTSPKGHPSPSVPSSGSPVPTAGSSVPADPAPSTSTPPASHPASLSLGQSWFGHPSTDAVAALRKLGFVVGDFRVCSSSVSAGQVRQILTGDGTVLDDKDGLTAAGRSVEYGAVLQMKVGNGTPCG
jgi:hypothetical protein